MLGRLEYQRGNFDAALQVFEGIDIRVLAPRMIRAIAERTKQRKPRSKVDNVLPNVMSMHSVSLLLEAILLKSKSLEELGRYTGITTFISLSDVLQILFFCLIQSLALICQRIVNNCPYYHPCIINASSIQYTNYFCFLIYQRLRKSAELLWIQ